MHRFAFCLIFACAGSPAPAIAPLPQPPPRELVVGIVEDPRFVPIDRVELPRMFREAEAQFARSFSPLPIVPRFVEAASVDEFFAQHREAMAHCLERFGPLVRPGEAPLIDEARVVTALREHALHEWEQFLEQPLADYAALTALLRDRSVAGWIELSRQRAPDGSPLWKDWTSHARWTCAMWAQNRFDVVITNSPLIYDWTVRLQPFKKLPQIGGFASRHSSRSALRMQTVVVSTFQVDTALEPLRQSGVGELSVAERYELLGRHVLAHELGHAYARAADEVAHDGCLMNSTKDLGWIAADARVRHSLPCAKCARLRQELALFVRAEEAFERGAWVDAVRAYSDSILAVAADPLRHDRVKEEVAYLLRRAIGSGVERAFLSGLRLVSSVILRPRAPSLRDFQFDGSIIRLQTERAGPMTECVASPALSVDLSRASALVGRSVRAFTCSTAASVAITELSFDLGGVTHIRCKDAQADVRLLVPSLTSRSTSTLTGTCESWAADINHVLPLDGDVFEALFGPNAQIVTVFAELAVRLLMPAK